MKSERSGEQFVGRIGRGIQDQSRVGPALVFGPSFQHPGPCHLGHPCDIANPRLDPPAVNRFIRADAFNDLQIGPVFRGKISPGGAGRLDRIDGVGNDGMSEPQMFAGQRDRDIIGGDAG